MSFTLNAVAQAKGSHSNTGANDSAEPLNTTRSRSRTPGAKGGVSPTSSHHLFSREGASEAGPNPMARFRFSRPAPLDPAHIVKSTRGQCGVTVIFLLA